MFFVDEGAYLEIDVDELALASGSGGRLLKRQLLGLCLVLGLYTRLIAAVDVTHLNLMSESLGFSY